MHLLKGDHPPHVIDWHENVNEVERLSHIHASLVGNARGKKGNIEIINKSCIVLLVACWENFIESLLCNAFDYMLKNAKSPSTFPDTVLSKASKQIKNDPDERKIWNLAQDGWKNVLELYKDTLLTKEIDYFHVPNAENIDSLFEKLIGIKKISTKWTWKGKVNSDAIKNLRTLIALRGNIAHKVKAGKLVTNKEVKYYIDLLNDIAVITHNEVTKYVTRKTASSPWDIYVYHRKPN